MEETTDLALVEHATDRGAEHERDERQDEESTNRAEAHDPTIDAALGTGKESF